MRNDPAEGYKAQGVPEHPVGTVDELLAHKLPTKVFRSCAEPTSDGAVKGCAHWYDCTMSYKGLPASEGGGPRNHCWERIMGPNQGGAIVRNVQPCFWGVAQQDVAMANKDVLQPIADEGEKYELLTTVPDPSGGRDNAGFLKWDHKLIEAKVQPFKRLGEEQRLAAHELRAKVIQREQERLRNERPARALGITGGDTPLDKRGRRSSEGAPAKG